MRDDLAERTVFLCWDPDSGSLGDKRSAFTPREASVASRRKHKVVRKSIYSIGLFMIHSAVVARTTQNMSTIYASLLFGLMICAAHVAGFYSSYNYALQFSSSGVSDYVNIWGMPSLTQFTVCLWMKSSSGTDGTPFSYAVNGQANELLLYDYGSLKLYIGNQYRNTGVSANDGRWHHICVIWTNSNGGWHIYKDGVLQNHGINLRRGYRIRYGGSLVLGQEQDSLGGSFVSSQRFVGLLAGVNVWNRVLSASQIWTYSRSCFYGFGNVYRWSDFRDAIKGNTGLVVPSNCSPSSKG